MLITPEYAELNRQLHASTMFGMSAPKFIGSIEGAARAFDCKTVLDYGSGPRQWIKSFMGVMYDVRSYDPCVAELSSTPEPADLLVCIDMLEHSEPECLENILDDIARLTLKAAVMTIATVKAKKVLADGRNAHLIQRPVSWWMPKLMDRMKLDSFKLLNGEFICVMVK